MTTVPTLVPQKKGKIITARRGFVSYPARAGIADADAHAIIDKYAFSSALKRRKRESEANLLQKFQFFEAYF